MLGFLELSIASQNLIRDLGAFEELQFQPLRVNETWSHRYGVMGDGDFQVGLHDKPLEVPTLTFVLPDLAHHLPRLQELGIEFDFMHVSDQHFHEAGFTDAAGQKVWLLEARTFSPTLPDDEQQTLLGKFYEILLPARNNNHEQWAVLGYDESRADDAQTDGYPLASIPLRCDDHTQRLTVVYATALEALIVEAARRGWHNFSVTKENNGLIKTAHGFDILIRDTKTDSQN